MRYVMKGGIWKNSEDEILKVAVMKYGKNQWSRISSLLVRKTPKQCKSRWNEWLDPAIKKTEWSREEEEKLLHLAKIMPNQWRSIAPIVGRSAAQCVSHYERLLDAAQVEMHKEDGEGGVLDPSADPRKLRPGEVDPTPETKPARPDAVDMEEDEKEMLNEARARLANTKGKKAKRKAREKMMEEAKRLATLQKRRELRAAGIHVHNFKGRKRKDMDYNEEIPFLKPAKGGFFDVNEEVEIEKKMKEEPLFLRRTLEQLNGKRRADIESEAKKRDVKKQKLMKEYALPQYIAQINKVNNPEYDRPRPKLVLPQPQISDSELQAISKLGVQGSFAGANSSRMMTPALGATPVVTFGLFTPSRTPMVARTPQRTKALGDYIMQEAKDLLAWSNTETPLTGKMIPAVNHDDYRGITPKRQILGAMTPQAATPERFGASATPVFPNESSTSWETLDRSDAAAQAGLKRKQASLKNALKFGFSSLPAPKNEIALAGPMESDEQKEEMVVTLEEDMAEVRRRNLKAEMTAEQARLKRRTQAVQRDLPRPSSFSAAQYLALSLPSVPPFPGKTDLQPNYESLLEAELDVASHLIREEVALLVQRDVLHYPASTLSKASKQSVPNLENFEDSELVDAKMMIVTECNAFLSELSEEEKLLHEDAFASAFFSVQEELKFVPSRNASILLSSMSPSEKVEAYRSEWQQIVRIVQEQAKLNDKEQDKLELMLNGYVARSVKLDEALDESFGRFDAKVIETNSFKRLLENETANMPIRMDILRKELQLQKDREMELQSRYASLCREREKLLEAGKIL